MFEQCQSIMQRRQKAQAELSDAHCHLNLFPDPHGTVREALEKGIRIIIATGESAKDSRECAELADGKNVFAVIGVGPDFADSDSGFVDEMEGLVRGNRNIVGIGEIGLDVKVAESCSMEIQMEVFIRQVDLAMRLGLPIVIHSRGTLPEVAEILASRNARKAMFHFFDGDEMQAQILAAKGYVISIPPAETSKRKKVIKALSLNSIVAETDSPIVGKSPLDVVRVMDLIAKEKGIEAGSAARAITENIRTLFSIY